LTPGRGVPWLASVTLPVTLISCACKEMEIAQKHSSKIFAMGLLFRVNEIFLMRDLRGKIRERNVEKTEFNSVTRNGGFGDLILLAQCYCVLSI
jgi:hypothetical protein